MGGVLDTVLRLCVFRLFSSLLMCPSAVTHSITAASVCCICLLLFTDLAVTLFLLYVRLMDSWLTPFDVSSDVIALRFLLFLCQAYGVVLLLTPPLIAVEMLVNLLCSQDGLSKECWETESFSRAVGFFGSLLVWIVSGICCSHDWTLERLSVEACLTRGGCLVTCLPNVEELSYVPPAMAVLLVLTGSLGWSWRPSKYIHVAENKDHVVVHTWLTLADSDTAPDIRVSCRPEFMFRDSGNSVSCVHQTGLADNYIQKQKRSTFAKSETKTEVPALAESKKSVFIRSQNTRSRLPETETPRFGRELLAWLVCVVLVCVFPTVVSFNVLLICNLENLVAYGLKLLSQSVNRTPDL